MIRLRLSPRDVVTRTTTLKAMTKRRRRQPSPTVAAATCSSTTTTATRSSSSSSSSSDTNSSEKNVVMALSGGVDSAVALGLLLSDQSIQKYNVQQVIHMTNWNPHDDDSLSKTTTSTCVEQDWRDAQSIVEHYRQRNMTTLQKNPNFLELKHLSLEQVYWHTVFEPFLQDLTEKGWMGNPDIACNTHVKFGALWDIIQKKYPNSPTWLATGHYARLWRRQELEAWMENPTITTSNTSSSWDDSETIDWVWHWGRRPNDNDDGDLPLLVSAVDITKDQSYFLSACTSQQFSRVLFPLGNYYKNSQSSSTSSSQPSVRQLAQQWQLPVAQKRDSVGICFIGKRRGGFQSFLEQYWCDPFTHTDDNDGNRNQNYFDLIDVDTGTKVGVVNALKGQAMTIGQGARVSGSPYKYFVVGKNVSSGTKRTILVCGDTHHPALYSDTIHLSNDVSWLMCQCIPPPLVQTGRLRVQCRIRHLQPLVQATLLYDKLDHSYTLLLDQPLRGITPGQRAVFYLHGTICLGGATIAQAGPSYFDLSKPLPQPLHPTGVNDRSVVSLS